MYNDQLKSKKVQKEEVADVTSGYVTAFSELLPVAFTAKADL